MSDDDSITTKGGAASIASPFNFKTQTIATSPVKSVGAFPATPLGNMRRKLTIATLRS